MGSVESASARAASRRMSKWVLFALVLPLFVLTPGAAHQSVAAATDDTVATETSGDGGGDCAGTEGEPIAIGANVAVTGGAASIGEHWKTGLEAGVADVNERGISVNGECYSFELDLQDNETTPDQAIGVNQRFLRDGVSFIFGPGVSTIFTPAFESLRGSDVMVFTPATTAAALLGTEDGKYLFRTHLSDEGPDGRIAKMARAVTEHYSPTRVAMLVPQDPPGEIHREEFTNAFDEAGVEIVYSETFGPDVRDFAPFISEMSAADPDMVVIGYLDQWVEPFLAQAVDADFTSPVFVGSPGATFGAVEGKDAIEQYAISITTRAVDNPDDPQTAEFRATYEEIVGSPPDANAFWALSYYDAVQMLARAMEVAGSTTDLDAISEALRSDEATDYPTRALDLVFDATGQGEYTPQIAYLAGGEVTYEEVE